MKVYVYRDLMGRLSFFEGPQQEQFFDTDYGRFPQQQFVGVFELNADQGDSE